MKIPLFLGTFMVGVLTLLGVGVAPYAASAACAPLTQAVVFGQKGMAVQNLQQCLIDAGYSIPAGPTGYYGAQTRAAVKAFYTAILAIADWNGNSVGPKGRAALLSHASGVIKGGPGPTSATGFKRVASQAEFQKYVQANTDQSRYAGALYLPGISGGVATSGIVPPMVAPPTPAGAQGAAESVNSGTAVSSPDRYSTTNVQIPGIDEPDIVKTDGNNIYISQQGWGNIRPLMMGTVGGGVAVPKGMPGMPIYYNPQPTTIVSAFPLSSLGIASKDIKETGDMLLVKDKKILVIFSQPTIVAYDISNPKSPVKKWSFDLGNNTSIVTSRLKDGTVYLVTNTWINQTGPCPIVPMLKGGINFPIPCTDIWVPNQIEPVDTTYTVFAIDPTTGTAVNKLSVAGSNNNTVISMSDNNIYLTYRSQTAMTGVLIDFYAKQLTDFLSAATVARIQQINSYDISSASKMNEVQIAINAANAGMTADQQLKFNNEVQNRLSSYLDTRARDLDRSVIARIPLSTLTIAATGNIPGHLLNQFSLDEYAGNVRVAVTVGDQWGIGGGKTKNDVYVLDQNLATTGSIVNLGLTEQIYATRFVGPRGYLVTFRQTDPFYVLDLSNPLAPVMAGQLKIPGYSSYLEPIDATTVLGVGQEGSQVKLSLFNVTDPKNPVEKAKYTLAENWTDVSNNHHAFLKDDKHNVFFLPGGNGGYIFSYAGGALSLKATLAGYSINRAVYINDFLYMISNDKITVFDETTWTKVNELSLK